MAVGVLAACQPAGGPGAASRISLVPAVGGLMVEGSGGREIGFGRDRAGVIRSVGEVQGRAPRPASCGNGRDAVETEGGLRLVFEGGRFVGWSGAGASAGRTCA